LYLLQISRQGIDSHEAEILIVLHSRKERPPDWHLARAVPAGELLFARNG